MRIAALLCLLAAMPACGGDDDGGDSSEHPDAAGGDDAGGPDGGGGSMLELRGFTGGRYAQAPGPLTWVAAEDGDGPWQVLDAGADGIYLTPVTSGRYEVAYSCPLAFTQSIVIVEDTMAAHPSIDCRCIDDDDFSPFGDVTANVSGLDADGEATLYVGSSLRGFTQAAPSAQIQSAAGTWDGVLVVRPNGTVISRLVIERDVPVNEGGSTGLSMSATAGAPAAVVAIAVGGAGGDTEEHHVAFHTASGSRGFLTKGDFQETSRAVPAELLMADDMHELAVRATATSTERTASRWFHEPADVAVTLPEPMGAVTVSGAPGAPYGRPAFSFDTVDGATAYRGSVTQIGAGKTTYVNLTVTAAWMGTADRVEWTMPDFSDLAGFDPAWAPVAGDSALWYASVVTTDRDLYDLPDGRGLVDRFERPKAAWDGAVDTVSLRAGNFTP